MKEEEGRRVEEGEGRAVKGSSRSGERKEV